MFKKIINSSFNTLTNNLKNQCVINKRFYKTADFTKNNYDVTRGNYNYLHEDHVNFFRDILGEQRIVRDLSDLEKYNVDWMSQARGCSTIVLKPKTTEEVSKILQFCNSNNLAVCPQGGNTGVVAGGVPIFDEIIVSMELMNKVISIDEVSGVLVCQSGCVLENLNNYLYDKGLMVPLDLGSKGSCQIGGNVSTNAGGLRLLRYGSMHGNVLGLEAVKANGEIVDCLSTLRKDNTGFHLKHLFIGSEGTLGVVTKVSIQCPPRPKNVNLAFLGLENFEKVLKTFKKAKQDLGEILSAVEVIDTPTMDFIKEHLDKQSPIGDYPFYLLIETSGSNQQHDELKLEEFLENAMSTSHILNGTMATDESKVNTIWSLRERIPDGFKKEGHILIYDVSLPLEHYFTLVEDTRKHIGNLGKRVFGFGHLGDGNLHLQISLNSFSKEVKSFVEPYVFKRTLELNGSVSAEHGMGFLKAQYLHMANSEIAVDMMRDLKRIMDPNMILNPYKVFPTQHNKIN